MSLQSSCICLQVVLLVRNATGDEEVGAAGQQLRGVILAHSLPHLSHLGGSAGAATLCKHHAPAVGLAQHPSALLEAVIEHDHALAQSICHVSLLLPGVVDVSRTRFPDSAVDSGLNPDDVFVAGVRARQERVTFVTCEDEGLLDSEVRPLLGKRVRLQAGAQGVLLTADNAPAAGADSSAGNGAASAAAKPKAASGAITKVLLYALPSMLYSSSIPDQGACPGLSTDSATSAVLVSAAVLGLQVTKPQLVLLADADAARCGAKAAACGELARLAAGSDAGFAAPAAVVVPFGVMDLAIKVCRKGCGFCFHASYLARCAVHAALGPTMQLACH